MIEGGEVAGCSVNPELARRLRSREELHNRGVHPRTLAGEPCVVAFPTDQHLEQAPIDSLPLRARGVCALARVSICAGRPGTPKRGRAVRVQSLRRHLSSAENLGASYGDGANSTGNSNSAMRSPTSRNARETGRWSRRCPPSRRRPDRYGPMQRGNEFRADDLGDAMSLAEDVGARGRPEGQFANLPPQRFGHHEHQIGEIDHLGLEFAGLESGGVSTEADDDVRGKSFRRNADQRTRSRALGCQPGPGFVRSERSVSRSAITERQRLELQTNGTCIPTPYPALRARITTTG